MRVGFGIAARLVLADKAVEHVVGHCRLNAEVTRRTAVIKVELTVDDIGNQIRFAHRKASQRIGRDVVFGFEEIRAAVKTRWKVGRTIENPADVTKQIHHVRRAGRDQNQCR